MTVPEIGCCGAYCGSCRALKDGSCKGCKLGYETGERELSKARCRIKVCCMTKGYRSCADCPEIETCGIMKEFSGKKGYKYKKYKEAIEFIRENGYDAFLEIADTWKGAYGRYQGR